MKFDWKNMPHIESEIESDHEQDTEQQKREKVLLKWKDQQGSDTTCRKLFHALRIVIVWHVFICVVD